MWTRSANISADEEPSGWGTREARKPSKEPDQFKELIEKYLPYDLSLNEMTAGVSQLCGQPENARLPVVYVLNVLSLKTRGGTPQEVEDVLSMNRKVSSMVFDSEKPTAKGKRCARPNR